MGALGTKLRSIGDAAGNHLGFVHWCPGCDGAHAFYTVARDARPVWTWNGDADRPTTSPSMRVSFRHPKGHTNENPAPVGYSGPYVEEICHYYLKDGMIEFCGDCTHALSGKKVPLPDWPESHEDFAS